MFHNSEDLKCLIENNVADKRNSTSYAGISGFSYEVQKVKNIFGLIQMSENWELDLDIHFVRRFTVESLLNREQFR